MKKGCRRALSLLISALLTAEAGMTAWADSVSLQSSSEIASGISDTFSTATVNGKSAEVWEIKKTDQLILGNLDLPYVEYRELSVGILYPQPDGTYRVDMLGDEPDYVGGADSYVMIDTDLQAGKEYAVYELLKNSGELGGHDMDECLFFLMFRYDKEGEDTIWTGDIYVKFVGSEPDSDGSGQSASLYWISDAKGWKVNRADGAYLRNTWYQSPETGLWYYLDTVGYMVTARWIQPVSGGYWYYLSEDGHMRASQWFRSPGDGNWYYLADDGHMLTDTVTPDGHYVNADGVWVQ